jgi:glyoxylase I family protein
MILGLNHISILVADLEVSLTFYRDLLGLKVMARPPLGFEGAWLALGQGIDLHLLVLPNPDPIDQRPEHAGRDRHIALMVADLDLAKTRLMTHNIPFTLSRSGRASLFCRDPDGNGVELMLLST